MPVNFYVLGFRQQTKGQRTLDFTAKASVELGRRKCTACSENSCSSDCAPRKGEHFTSRIPGSLRVQHRLNHSEPLISDEVAGDMRLELTKQGPLIKRLEVYLMVELDWKMQRMIYGSWK
jgi:hypothetical protein